MRQAAFEASYFEAWSRFERWLDDRQKPKRAGSRRVEPAAPPGLADAEVPRAYRQLCHHLALARDRAYSPDLVDRLNELALRGHHVLYGARSQRRGQVAQFFLADFPRRVRAEWRLVAIAAAAFLGPVLAIAAALQHHPDFVHYLLAPRALAQIEEMYDPANPRLGMRAADTNVMMFAFYIWNNVKIGFQCFATGLAFGLGTLFYLVSNGVQIGAVAGHLTHAGFGAPFWSFVSGHSALELVAIVLCGAAGLKLGAALIGPGNLSRRAALVAAARGAIRLVYGAAAMFLGAAFVEAFWSPLTAFPPASKYAVGAILWALVLGYFALAGAPPCSRRVGVDLRPRPPWEAIDLGFLMAREWSGALYAAFLAIFVPVVVALHAALADRLWLAALLAWWLKPLFDRFALHVVSRAVFGEVPGVRATLAVWREIASPGLVAGLTLHRFNLARSLVLPVWQLEKSRGRAARERRATLGRRMRSHAVGLTVACLHFEAVVVFSLGALVALVSPGAGEVEFDAALWWRDGAAAWTLADSVAYMSAIALIEPFYIAGGFSLYLNRRAVLEGWDVEVALRRMATRLAGARPAAAFAAVALGGALALGGGEALAQPAAGKSARGEIVEVLKAPEFQEHREVMRWRYRGGAERPDDPTRERGAAGFLDGLARFLAVLAEFGLWLAVAALVVAALLAARRFVPSLAEARAERYRPPETLFGLALAPQSLPPDLAAAACDLIAGGRMREALSLLYRGALSTLAHRDGVRLAAGDTEGDCTRAARRMLPEGAARYFERLVGTWQGAAYAARLPEPGVALELALEWPAHFGAGNGAAQERA